MKKLHYAWLICAGCTLLMFCTVGLTTSAFSVYQPYIIEAGGLTNTQGSTVITIRSLFALAAMFLVGKYNSTLGSRRGVALAAVGSAISFFIFSVTRSFPGYCVAAAISGISYAFGGMIPMSILIGRWFHSHRALALGICTAGTGAATIVAPPVITSIIHSVSLSAAFICEGAFIAVSAAVLFIVLRDKPKDKGLCALGDSADIVNAVIPGGRADMSRAVYAVMLFSMALIGAVANPGFSHLSVLYKTEGFSANDVSLLLSVVGVTLTVGKCIYGTVTDRLGSYKSGYLFFLLLIAGEVLQCLAGLGSKLTALSGMAVLGLGLPISTVGLSVLAGDMSTPERYSATVRNFQMAYMVGALLFGPVPGVIADMFGSYVPSYVILSAFSLVSMALVQLTRRHMVKLHKNSSLKDALK